MDFYGAHFEYDGQDSSEYGLIIASLEESQNRDLSGKAKLVTLFNRRNDRLYYIDTDYKDAPMEYDLEIVSEDALSVTEQRAIEKWLFHQRGFKKFTIVAEDDCEIDEAETVDGSVKRIFVNCIFTSPSKIMGADGVHGYRFQVNCDSPVGWQETITKAISIGGTDSSDENVITISIDSDLHEYVYPKVTVLMSAAGGDFSVANETDSVYRLTSFVSIPSEVAITTDGNLNYVTNGYYGYFKDRNFVRLLDGDNQIRITGAVDSVTFEWQNRRYI